MQREGAWTAVWAPISLAEIGALLLKEGFEVKLHDCIVEGIEIARLKEIISDFKPGLIICNTSTPSIESDLKVAAVAKEISPEIRVAFFGIHVSALPDDCFRLEPKIDYLIRGEPEITALELTRCLKDQQSLPGIDGLSYQSEEKIIHNRDREPIKDLDSLPYPAWQLVETDKYLLPFTNRPFLLVSVGRGCPFNCTFCAAKTYYGERLRLPSVKRVVDELTWIKNRFRVSDFLFWAESFTINKEFAEAVCDEIIKRGLKIKFVVNSRVTGVDQELMQKLKKAGCWMIGYGIESGDQRILDNVDKGITIEDIKKAVKMSKEFGLEVTGHVIFGLPGETKETMERTLKFCIDLDLEFAQFYCAVPFPGSRLYEEALQKGWIKDFSWPNFEQNFCVLDYGTLSAKEIMDFRNRAFRRFYLRPKMILKTLGRIRSVGEFKALFNMLKDFLTWI